VSVRFGKNGYFEVEYKGFDGGLNVQEPETEIADNCTPFANNFQNRNKELRSRPAFMLQFAGIDTANPGLGLYSFADANGVTHTVGWNTRGLWQLAPAGLPPGAVGQWFLIGGPNLLAGVPVAYQAFANVLYYSNGGQFLASWDGITTTPTASNASAPGSTSIAAISVANAPTVVPGSTGPLSFGGVFLGELNNQLLLANISLIDNGTGTPYLFQNRMWWSANGIPNQWDFAANTSAGENDFLDVPDGITGLMTIGVNGFLFRTNGITFFTPTSSSLTPFQFDHLWASNHGIGNVYPWSIHSYGSIGCFISLEQIYQMGLSSFEAIGGKARDSIMADLALTSGVPTGAIVPTERVGYVYMTYRISIPLTTFTRHYWYNIEDKNWLQFDTPGLVQTGRCEEVWTGVLANLPIGVQPASSNAGGGGPGGGGGRGDIIGQFRGGG